MKKSFKKRFLKRTGTGRRRFLRVRRKFAKRKPLSRSKFGHKVMKVLRMNEELKLFDSAVNTGIPNSAAVTKTTNGFFAAAIGFGDPVGFAMSTLNALVFSDN